MKNKLFFLIALLTALVATTHAEDLIGWDGGTTTNVAFQATGISGTLFTSGIFAVNTTGGSTDGTFGSGIAGAAIEKEAYVVNTGIDNTTLGIQISNNSGSTLQLDTLSFDYSRWWANAPKDITLTYAFGDLADDNGTFIQSATNLPDEEQTGDYRDFDWDLSGLADPVLGDGQKATFQLTVSNSGADASAGGIDNVAISGVRIVKSEVLLTSPPSEVTVWLMGGQSNMRGHGNPADVTDPVYQTPQTDVLFWHNQHNEKVQWVTGDEYGWENLFWGGGKTETDGDGGFGPELSLGRALADALPGNNVALIKHAVGSTSLHTHWNVAGEGGPVYQDFLETAHAALLDLTNRGISYHIEGMIWMQGEHDTVTLTDANNYDANLTALIAAIRTEFNEPAMTFVAGRIYGFGDYTNEVRTAITNVTESDALAAWVDVDGLPLVSYDSIHMNAEAQLEFGKRLAQTYQQGLHDKSITGGSILSNSNFEITWDSTAGETYEVLTTTNLTSGIWTAATNNSPSNAYSHSTDEAPTRFFKVGRQL